MDLMQQSWAGGVNTWISDLSQASKIQCEANATEHVGDTLLHILICTSLSQKSRFRNSNVFCNFYKITTSCHSFRSRKTAPHRQGTAVCHPDFDKERSQWQHQRKVLVAILCVFCKATEPPKQDVCLSVRYTDIPGYTVQMARYGWWWTCGSGAHLQTNLRGAAGVSPQDIAISERSKWSKSWKAKYQAIWWYLMYSLWISNHWYHQGPTGRLKPHLCSAVPPPAPAAPTAVLVARMHTQHGWPAIAGRHQKKNRSNMLEHYINIIILTWRPHII